MHLAICQLCAGESVWFGSDVGHASDRQLGILDTNITCMQALFNTDFTKPMPARLAYGDA